MAYLKAACMSIYIILGGCFCNDGSSNLVYDESDDTWKMRDTAVTAAAADKSSENHNKESHQHQKQKSMKKRQ